MRSIKPGFHGGLVALGLMTSLACGGGGGSSTPPAPVPIPEPTNKVTLILPPASKVGGGSYWVACQDGQGTWKVLTGVSSGPNSSTYTFQVNDPSGRYGLAVVNAFPVGGGDGYLGLLHQLTLSEVRTLDYSTWGPATTALVSCSVSGLSGTDGARVSVGATTKTLNPGASATNLSAVVGGADLVAVRLPGMGAADSLVAYRGYPVTATGPMAVDFNFINGWPLVAQQVSVSGFSATENLTLTADWRTPTTTIKLAEGATSSLAFRAVPTDRMQSGDLHGLMATAYDSGALSYRYAAAYSLAAANVTLPLPQMPTAPSFGSGRGTAYYRPAISWTALDGAMLHATTIGDAYAYLDWNIQVSKGWLGQAVSPAYTFPDFSALQGWSSSWGLPFGRDLYWNFSQMQTTYADPGFYIKGPRSYKAGSTAWESMVYGGLNVPSGAVRVQPGVRMVQGQPQSAQEGGSYLREVLVRGD